MANNHSEIERRLWSSADQLRANSGLKSSEYSVPVLGLIFLRFADHKFAIAEKELAGKGTGRRKIGNEDYQAQGVMFLPPQARFSYLLGKQRATHLFCGNNVPPIYFAILGTRRGRGTGRLWAPVGKLVRKPCDKGR